MAPWLIAVIFVVVVAGGGWLVDARARRLRRGLSRLSTSEEESRPHSAVEGSVPGDVPPPPALPY